MKVLTLLLILSGVFGRDVNAARRPRRPNSCEVAMGSRPRVIDHARRFTEAFGIFEREDLAPRERIAGLAEALREYRASVAEDRVGRSVRNRLSNAREVLYRYFFDQDQSVRYAAVHAVAALLNNRIALTNRPFTEPAREEDELIKNEVAAYLAPKAPRPFALVRIVRTVPGVGGWVVELDVTVTNELAVPFLGGPIRVGIPAGVGAVPIVTLAATDISGLVRSEGRVFGYRDEDVLNVTGRFRINVPSAVALGHATLFVDLRLDGYALEQKILGGAALAAARVVDTPPSPTLARPVPKRTEPYEP